MQLGGVLILVVALIQHDPGQVRGVLEAMAVCSWSWRTEVQVLYVEMEELNPSTELM